MPKQLKLSIIFFLAIVLVGAAYFLPKYDTRKVENSDWSLQGEWIVFSCIVGYESHLYLVRPDGSELTKLTTDEIVSEIIPHNAVLGARW